MGVIFSRTRTVMDKGIIPPGAGDVAPEDERTKIERGNYRAFACTRGSMIVQIHSAISRIFLVWM